MKIKSRSSNKKTLKISLFLGALILVVVGYAYLNASLSIKGTTEIGDLKWDIHFANITNEEGITPKNPAAINEEDPTKIDFGIQISKPGDSYSFNVDVINTGNLDAMVDSIELTGLTDEQKKLLTYKVTYSDGVEIQSNDLLAKSTTETIKVKVEFKEDLTVAEFNNFAKGTLTLTFKLNFIQKTDDAKEVEHKKKCIRATTLHTETCSQTSTSSYCSGAGYTATGSKGTTTITYGNLGTIGTLTSGDAFTCDVNGDGEYNEETERFYYVTDNNSDTAVLIYYNNTSAGAPDNMSAYAYVSKDDYIAAGGTETDYGSDGNWNKGPLTVIKQLPTTEQWANVSLTNTTRDIKDQKGATRITGFSYSGYAARLLTYEEIYNSCYNGNTTISYSGGLDGCNYLFENTKYSNSFLKTYGPWLETPHASSLNSAWYVRGDYHSADIFDVCSASIRGARPAIEILKSDISY